MKRGILLVEPGYKSLYPPLALMKISSWHKKQGDEVDLVNQFKRSLEDVKNGRIRRVA